MYHSFCHRTSTQGKQVKPDVDEHIGLKIDPDAIHIMKKSEYSGMFGDYSSFSGEFMLVCNIVVPGLFVSHRPLAVAHTFGRGVYHDAQDHEYREQRVDHG